MFCNRIYDFVTQTEVELAAPPCHSAETAEREQPVWDIIRPNLAAADMIKRHEDALLKLTMGRAA